MISWYKPDRMSCKQSEPGECIWAANGICRRCSMLKRSPVGVKRSSAWPVHMWVWRMPADVNHSDDEIVADGDACRSVSNTTEDVEPVSHTVHCNILWCISDFRMKASLAKWTRPFTCWFMQCHCFCLQQSRTSISRTVTLPLGGTPEGTGKLEYRSLLPFTHSTACPHAVNVAEQIQCNTYVTRQEEDKTPLNTFARVFPRCVRLLRGIVCVVLRGILCVVLRHHEGWYCAETHIHCSAKNHPL